MYYMKGSGGLTEILKWPNWMRRFFLQEIQKKKKEETEFIGNVVSEHLKGIGHMLGGK